MKKIILLLNLSLIGFANSFFVSCKKDGEKEITSTTIDTSISISTDGINASEVAIIDSLETDTTTKFSDILFSDSTSVKDFLIQHDPSFLTLFPSRSMQYSQSLTLIEKKKLLLARMQAVAFNLVTRPYHQIPDSGGNKPGQNGLAYIYGSKQWKQRENSVGACKSSILLYGLDCSGMIYQMAYNSGLNLSSDPKASNCNVEYLSDTANWNSAFKKSTDFNGIKMTKLNQIIPSQIEFGDIIIWKGHIGMVLNSNTLRIFQSNGYSDSQCQKNTDTRHGPSIKKLTSGFLLEPSFGGSYKILRIILTTNTVGNTYASWNVNGLAYNTLSNGIYQANFHDVYTGITGAGFQFFSGTGALDALTIMLPVNSTGTFAIPGGKAGWLEAGSPNIYTSISGTGSLTITESTTDTVAGTFYFNAKKFGDTTATAFITGGGFRVKKN